MASRNYLIGRGESLVESIEIKTGGGDKSYPYTFSEARSALSPMWQETARKLGELPDKACPQGEAVISVTLHPSFMAKSHFPTHLLQDMRLRLVGSRQRIIKPRKISKSQSRKELPAPELLLAGQVEDVKRFARNSTQWLPDETLQKEYSRIEEVRTLEGTQIKSIPDDGKAIPLEVVVHTDSNENGQVSILRSFESWCSEIGVEYSPSLRRSVGGLSFLAVKADRSKVDDLAKFSFVRAVRKMPSLRIEDCSGTEVAGRLPIILPSTGPANNDCRLAIFDGGLSNSSVLAPWVDYHQISDAGAPVRSCTDHGFGVTSAALFGHIENGATIPQPYSRIDHWRVVGSNHRADDFELIDVLDRIVNILRQRQYNVVSLSLGPDEAMLDDDVHVWTATLDQYCAAGTTLVISAAGNNGNLDAFSGLNRVQPPSDGVNMLGVGASDHIGKDWSRAPYSPVGPGRSPGVTKPDIMAFGGSGRLQFNVIDPHDVSRSIGKMGTSYAAPSAARIAIGLNSHFGSQLRAIATKAILVHFCERSGQHVAEVGWGRVPNDLEEVAVCAEDEATIVYQGVLEPSRFMRFLIPEPIDGYKTRITVRSTFCFMTPVDPENSLNYTCTGLGITFRPSTIGSPGYNADGTLKQAHPSKSFFGKNALFQPEHNLRDDARKWETVLKAERRFNAGSLARPVFDIEHQAREAGQNAPRSENIPYALILTVKAPNEGDLYNRILRAYPGRLQVMQPAIEVPVRIRK